MPINTIFSLYISILNPIRGMGGGETKSYCSFQRFFTDYSIKTILHKGGRLKKIERTDQEFVKQTLESASHTAKPIARLTAKK